jgi:predicted  nucleic acid-binding Zn-ribbon protein
MNTPENNETEIWKSRAHAHEENYNQMLKRVDELAAENKLWQEEAKRWRDMYLEFDEMLEERVNEAVERLEKVWEGLDELKRKVEDEY